jgi:hypothetical protein
MFYTILSPGDPGEVEVTHETTSCNSYRGAIAIPSTVEDGHGAEYSVTAIGEYAFLLRGSDIRRHSRLGEAYRRVRFYRDRPDITSLTHPAAQYTAGEEVTPEVEVQNDPPTDDSTLSYR